MTNLYIALTMVLVFVAIAIIALVLLQKGKGADAGAAFGAGASGTVFGARGSTNFLSRATAVMAVLFFSTCLGLAYLSTQRTGPESLLEDAAVDEVAMKATDENLAVDDFELDIPEADTSGAAESLSVDDLPEPPNDDIAAEQPAAQND